MKMDAAYSQIYYPFDVNANQRSLSYQRSSQDDQMCRFDTMIDSGNFIGIGYEKPMAISQPQEAVCCFHDRHFMDYTNIGHRHNAFNTMNNIDSLAVDESFSNFTESVKAELDTIPGGIAQSAIETDIRNFENSVKEALDNFTNDLTTLVQNQTELFELAFNELKNAISVYLDSDNSDTEPELPETKNTGDVADSATTNAQPFNFEEFEINFREKFMAALDELLKALKEASHANGDFVDKGIGKGYPSSCGTYANMMEITNSNNLGSDQETFTVSA